MKNARTKRSACSFSFLNMQICDVINAIVIVVALTPLYDCDRQRWKTKGIWQNLAWFSLVFKRLRTGISAKSLTISCCSVVTSNISSRTSRLNPRSSLSLKVQKSIVPDTCRNIHVKNMQIQIFNTFFFLRVLKNIDLGTCLEFCQQMLKDLNVIIRCAGAW